jgi:hypothetical protein
MRGHILRGHIFIDKPSPTFNCTRRAEFATRPARLIRVICYTMILPKVIS